MNSVSHDTDTDPDVLRAALAYAARGWPVAPAQSVRDDGSCTCGLAECGSPGKHPLTAHGLKDASTDAATIRSWWARWPHANVIIRTGMVGNRCLVAVDIDPRHHGDESLAALLAEHGEFPPTPMTCTGGGGQHIFFWAARAVPNSINRVGDGIDIRGEGGYVVAAPSRHASGRTYEWDSGAHPADVPLAESPQWLLDASGRYRKPADVGHVDAGDFIIGSRNVALTRLAGIMRRPGIAESAILVALLNINETKCKPPLDPAEVRAIAHSIGKRTPGDPIDVSTAEPFKVLDASDMATELPPTPWVCEELKIAPGGVTIIGGAGYGGKTISMQALALAVASGRKLWGQIEVASGRVIHLDYEQGRPLTQRRYQRIARAMGVSWADLQSRGTFGLVCLPKGKLSDAAAEQNMIRACTGAKVCIVDSFRRAFPKAKENDSEACEYLDMLQRVSEATGCTMLVIMHTRKAGEDTDLRNSLRGSAALFDASQACFMLSGTKGKPTQVAHLKDRIEGSTIETFGLNVKDIHGPDGDRRWGLLVEYVHTADMQAAYYESSNEPEYDMAASHESLMMLVARCIEFVNKSGDKGAIGSTIRSAVQRSWQDTVAALSEAVRNGALRVDGKGQNAAYFAY